ncbi:MAG: SMI1/KNR4 family protein [Pirellulaceae bacterium]|nr:SMI1/KNR4 family protein [Pirellulaceae bacterium]
MTTTIEGLLNKDTGDGASLDAIRAAERELGIKFPFDYESYLRTYGWVRLIYDELYGLGDSVPAHLNLITNTLRERTDFCPRLPNHLVPFMPDGAGNHYCLDLSRTESGNCPVVFWDHDEGEDQTPSIVAKSFSDWIVEHVTEQT